MPPNTPRTTPPVVESSPKSPPPPDEAASASVVLAPGAERPVATVGAAAMLAPESASAVSSVARDPNASPTLIRSLPSRDDGDRAIAEEEQRRTNAAAGPPKAPVRDPRQAGQPTDNRPDPQGLEGAPTPGPRPSPCRSVLYTVGTPGEGAYAHSLNVAGIEPGETRPATITKVHPDGTVDLYVMCGATGSHGVPRVAQADAPAGTERARGKWQWPER